MRQIKFRAIFDGKITYDMSLEGMFAHYENGSCQLEQFTGLTDENGNDIYEGDIVKYDFTHKDKRETFSTIEFSKYDDDEQFSTYSHLGWNFNGYSLSCRHKEILVVGNIHEIVPKETE
jgi:hypothetical protein